MTREENSQPPTTAEDKKSTAEVRDDPSRTGSPLGSGFSNKLDATDKLGQDVKPAPIATSTPATAAKVTESVAPSTTTTTTTTAAATHSDEDSMNAPDFQGEVLTTNDLPTIETLRKIEAYTVLDHDGKSHTFKSLYAGRNSPRRVLIIFVRHFFCGNCQEYLRILSASITPDALLQLPVSTFIAVIGCGAPQLINTYIEETGCPFPVYADPTCRLYSELGMVRTLAMGPRPAYMQGKSVAHTVISGVVQGLKQVKSGLVMKMGDQRQVGGEFLFEPATLALDTPISTPRSEEDKSLGNHQETDPKVEEKRVTWCHRMRTTRDHAEMPELMEVLGLDGEGAPIKDKKRWAKALQTRKGTGLSMASQMSRMSVDTTHTAGGSVKA
ncbi:hypothetical protein GGR53DRAFT_210164 [Hypoxylon sp. FL1150]|nr:hypothetical protein GGR53DRAFT_210164 [Hypoxylon sp. FL1150]